MDQKGGIMGPVTTTIEKGIALVEIDNPPVNALSQAVRQGLVEAIAAANQETTAKLILIFCAGRTFVAGADIREFGKPPMEPFLPDVLNIVEASAKPVIAAIHGTALGGGLELAMACHYRIADENATLGQPEVKLGLIPGAGGTQRLPRLAGIRTALDMIVSGNPVSAQSAREAGFVNRISMGDLKADALTYADEIMESGSLPRRTRDIEIDRKGLEDGFFEEYRRSIARRTRGYFAPERCLQAIEAALTLPFDEGLAKERALFMDCMASPQSGALRHVFFAERQCSRVPGIGKDVTPRPVERVGIIGAGTMGGGIGMAFLNAAFPVTMVEVSKQALDRGLAAISRNYGISAKRGKVTEAQIEERMGRLNATTAMEDLSDADIIIEAVFEKMEIKKEIFADLDRIAKPGAILATNTSYLNIDEIAAVTARPEDVMGTHFFSPANIMRLLEIVKAKKTAPDTVVTALKLAMKIGKVGVVSGVCHGFIGNRMLEGYGREAGLLLLEGASPMEVDKALFDFGMPMGPFQMWDLAGMDIGYMLRQQFPADHFDPNAYRVANRLVEMGRKGQKTGAGIYLYEEGSRTPTADPAVEAIILEEAEKAGITRREIGPEEIVQRCIYPLINTGARILEEGIAARPGDIDTVWVNGYGFPAYRGGPMYYADQLGLSEIVRTIEDFAGRMGERWWRPAGLLKKLAEKGENFASLDH